MRRCATQVKTLAAELEAAGLDVLLDDRDERAGVKFKDADLVGIPYRINVGKKVAAGQVEVVTRATASSVDVAMDAVVALVKERVERRCIAADGLRRTTARISTKGVAMALKIRLARPTGKHPWAMMLVRVALLLSWWWAWWPLRSADSITSSTRA